MLVAESNNTAVVGAGGLRQLAVIARRTMQLLAPATLHGAIYNEAPLTFEGAHVAISMQRLGHTSGFAIGARTGWHALDADRTVESVASSAPSVAEEHLYVLPASWITALDRGAHATTAQAVDFAVVQYMHGAMNLVTYGTNASSVPITTNTSSVGGVGSLFSEVSEILAYNTSSRKRLGYNAENTSDPATQLGVAMRISRELHSIESSLYELRCSQYDGAANAWSAESSEPGVRSNRTADESTGHVAIRTCRMGIVTDAIAVASFEKSVYFTLRDSDKAETSTDFWILIGAIGAAILLVASVCGIVGTRRG